MLLHILHILQVVGRIVLEVELLLPLVRIALACLTVDSLQLLQAQAVGEQHSMLELDASNAADVHALVKGAAAP